MGTSDFLNIAGSVAGLAGLSIALVLIVFRDVIRKNIFPRLSKIQAYNLIRLITILAAIIAVLGIAAWLIKIPLEKIWAVQPSGNGDVVAVASPPRIISASIDGIEDLSSIRCNSNAPCGPLRPGARLHAEMDGNGFAALFIQDDQSLFLPLQVQAFIRNLKVGDIKLDTVGIGTFNRIYIVTSTSDFRFDGAGRMKDLPEGEVWGPVYVDMSKIEDTIPGIAMGNSNNPVFDSIKIFLPGDKTNAVITIDGHPARVLGDGIARKILVCRSDKPHRIVVESTEDSCVAANVFVPRGSVELYPCQ